MSLINTKIRPIGAELFLADGKTDGHDEANSRCSQLRERALKPFFFKKKKKLVAQRISRFLMTLRISSDYFLGRLYVLRGVGTELLNKVSDPEVSSRLLPRADIRNRDSQMLGNV